MDEVICCPVLATNMDSRCTRNSSLFWPIWFTYLPQSAHHLYIVLTLFLWLHCKPLPWQVRPHPSVPWSPWCCAKSFSPLLSVGPVPRHGVLWQSINVTSSWHHSPNTVWQYAWPYMAMYSRQCTVGNAWESDNGIFDIIKFSSTYSWKMSRLIYFF